MKHIIKILLACLVSIFVMQACYKDKGNYDLIDYNRILTLGTAGSTVVILGDTLKLKPVIKWQYPDRDTTAFDFRWIQIDSVVSTARELAYTPDISGYFNLYLEVEERETGIVSRYAMQIQSISPFRVGWLLLTNNGGKSGLSYVRRDQKRDANNQIYYEYKFYPDIYASMYTDELGENPIRLVTKVWPDWALDEVMVVQGNTPVFLSGDDFRKRIHLKSEFPGQAFPNSEKPVSYVDGSAANFTLTEEGKVYWKRNSIGMGGLHQGMFIDVPVYFEGGDARVTHLFETDMDNSYFLYGYDELNRRYVGFYTTNGTGDNTGSKLFLANDATPPAGFVDLNDQTGYEHKYTSDYANGQYYMNIIRNETTNEYLYQTYRLTMNWSYVGVTEHTQEPFAGSAMITDNTVYFRIKNSSYLFFGEGSKLYFYDVNTKKVALYHDFGSGRIVKMTTDAPSTELGVATDNGRFYIVSLKNEVLGNPNPGSVGLLYTAPPMSPVVDLAWKWGSYFQYVFKSYQ
jgi:hypothetical protein